MKFNPDARIDSSRIDDAGGRSGGGRVGLVLMLLGLLYRWWQSRRTSGATS